MLVQVTEVIGESTEDWTDALQNAVVSASKSINGITGVEVVNWSAVVDKGNITKYKVDCKVAFVQ